MSHLLDTSILVRLANGSDPLHPLAVAALTALIRDDEQLYVAPQNLIEFWSVCTRPLEANGGLGLSVEDARSTVDVLAAELPCTRHTGYLSGSAKNSWRCSRDRQASSRRAAGSRLSCAWDCECRYIQCAALCAVH